LRHRAGEVLVVDGISVSIKNSQTRKRGCGLRGRRGVFGERFVMKKDGERLVNDDERA
jgi:hypothetical protein